MLRQQAAFITLFVAEVVTASAAQHVDTGMVAWGKKVGWHGISMGRGQLWSGQTVVRPLWSGQ